MLRINPHSVRHYEHMCSLDEPKIDALIFINFIRDSAMLQGIKNNNNNNDKCIRPAEGPYCSSALHICPQLLLYFTHFTANSRL